MDKQKLDCFFRIHNKTFKISSLFALFIFAGRAHYLQKLHWWNLFPEKQMRRFAGLVQLEQFKKYEKHL